MELDAAGAMAMPEVLDRPTSSSTFSFLRGRMDPSRAPAPASPSPSPSSSPPPPAPSPHPIGWRKGELIGAGAFGRVYMGMNLDSGELLAVKQVLIAANNIAKEKAQAHVKELEEEVKLLRNLTHPNIVRYLGTAREDDALNIFLEFVPGGSIASLLGKFGSFPEPVVRTYTRQLLQGLEYLHKNGIMHRDIKGANILVDNKGCIKLADFGASKQVVELVTLSGAKSMKGTPYWMAPEVIRQTGHSLPADIWSVGCTVIEMATGKPPWSQQFQEVAALFHIGTTKSHPPIPEHLSQEAQDFLLKCLKKEPYLRPTATELLQHPFVSQSLLENGGGLKHSLAVSTSIQNSFNGTKTSQMLESNKRRHLSQKLSEDSVVRRSLAFSQRSLLQDGSSNPQGVEKDPFRSCSDTDLNCSVRLDSVQFDDFMMKSANKSFKPCGFDSSTWEQSGFNPMDEPMSYNPMNEPYMEDDCINHEAGKMMNGDATKFNCPNHNYAREDSDFSFQCVAADDDEEVTESKIKAFLDEKALELKRLQTPLYMEYHSIWKPPQQDGETSIKNSSLHKGGMDMHGAPMSPAGRQLLTATNSRSPSKGSSLSGPSIAVSSRDSEGSVSSDSPAGDNPSVNFDSHIDSPRHNEWRGLLHEAQQPLPHNPSFNSAERQRQWKEELQKELEMRREEKRKLMRLAGKSTPNSKSCSPKDKASQRPVVSRLSCASPISRLPVES